jgi:hypothetical protein
VKAQKTIIFGSGEQVAGLARAFDLALLQRGMLGAEAHHHALAAVEVATACRLPCRRRRQRFQVGELQHLAALAADAGLQQLVAPLVLAAGFAGAGDAGVGLPGRCASSSDFTLGKGTASTVKGPVMRSLFLAIAGWS